MALRLLALALPVLATSILAAAADGFENFITRRGDVLMDGQREFRFIGINMPGLILPYDFTLSIDERMKLPIPWEQEDGLRTLGQMSARVVRLWNLPVRPPSQKDRPTWHHVQGPGQFNEDSFRVVDSALALANKYGVRVIFCLTAEAGDYLGGIGTYAAWRGRRREQFWTDRQVIEDFKATVRYVLTRRNTISGTAYRDDRAILCWEFGNELRSQPDDWAAEMAAFIKSIDPNHLVMDARDSRVPAEPLPDIDIYTRHYYGGDWVRACAADRAKLKGKRPFIVGEFGLSADVAMVGRFLDEVIANGTSGALLWSMYFHHRDGGFWWHQIFTHPSLSSYHWPGFSSGAAQKESELLALMRRKAFAIQGLAVSPVPVPDPPELLPIGEVPLISWRGSTGASGYDIERAASADGPWTTIARDVSDADTAYRPLYSDTSARTGGRYCYRVVARNSSGRSRPSNVVGPVHVDVVCLADELKDFSLAAGRSDGLKIVNDHNALYAEYPYRARGTAGEWIAYAPPGEIACANVVMFFAAGISDPVFEGSADGKAFDAMRAARTETVYRASPAGQGRKRIDYRLSAPPGTGHLRIRWTGEGELDRVEIFFRTATEPAGNR